MVTEAQRLQKAKADLSTKSGILKSVAGIIDNPKYKQDLIDIMNKHIEFAHKDSIPRIKKNVKNSDLAKMAAKFLKMNHKAFNQDLAIVISNYTKQTGSNADGSTSLDASTINTQLSGISQNSQTPQGDKAANDAISIELINRNIKKGRLINRRIIFFIVLIIAGFFLVRYILKQRNINLSQMQPQIPMPQ